MKEMEISIKDMLYHMLKRWRLLIVFVILFAVAMNGFGYLKAYKEQQSITAEKHNEEALKSAKREVKRAKAALSDSHATEAENVAGAYQTYLTTYEEYLDYQNNSYIMGLDAEHVPTIYIDFSVDTHYEATYPIMSYYDPVEEIIASLATSLKDETFYQKVQEVLGEDLDASYVSELVSVENYVNALNAEKLDVKLLEVKIVAKTKQQCEAIATLVEEQVLAAALQVQKVYGDFDVNKTTASYSERVDSDIQIVQRTVISQLSTLKTTYDNMLKSLTDEQKTYVNALVNYADIERGLEAKKDSTDVQKKDTSDIEIGYVYPKFIIIGILLGIILPCCFLCLGYLKTKALRVKEDVEITFEQNLLGVLQSDKKSKKWFRFIDAAIYNAFYGKGPKFSEEERANMICAGIRICANKQNLESVYFTGASNDEETTRVMELLVQKVKKAGIKVASGTSILYDPQSLETMAESSAVIFVESIGESLYKDMEKEIELANRYDVTILGTVVVNA
ncbi:MAG: hypothetical protein ACI4EK_02800 [Wujia sp.]